MKSLIAYFDNDNDEDDDYFCQSRLGYGTNRTF